MLLAGFATVAAIGGLVLYALLESHVERVIATPMQRRTGSPYP